MTLPGHAMTRGDVVMGAVQDGNHVKKEPRLGRETSGISSTGWDFRALSRVQKMSRVAFAGVLLGAVTVAVICFVDATRLVGKTFPGFLVNERLLASNFGSRHWTGPQGGIRYPDKILEANGKRVSSTEDLDGVVRNTAVGEPIVYVLERNENLIEIAVPTMQFGWLDLGLTFGPTFLAGLLYLLIAVVVYVLKPDTLSTWLLVIGCILIGTYQIITFDVASTHRFVRAALFIYAIGPAVGLHLSLLFPEKRRLADRSRIVHVIPYAVSMALAASAYALYPSPSFSTVYLLIRIYIGISVICLLTSVAHAYWRSASRLARQRAKVVLAGAGFAFPIPVIMSNLALVGSTPGSLQVLSTFLPFPLLVFPASIAYAIAKHNLFDVDVYLKRALGYVVMTAVVASGYFAVQTVVKTVVLDPVLGAASEQLYPFLFALLTVFAFNPLNQAVQQIVDKLFYRKSYDYRATVSSVSDALSAFVSLPAFLSSVVQRIRQDMFVDRVGAVVLDSRQETGDSVFLCDQPEENLSLERQDACLSPHDPLLTLLARERRLITKYDVAEDPAYAHVRDACGRRFAELGASLALPLFYRDAFAGLLVLGYKKSGHFYTREDVELLQTLCAMTSTAIEHAREKGQRAVLMQLFSKHVSPQVAQVLWEQREQFLEGGRPRSQMLTITAMFTDLQGFSTISERQDPEALMKWLNTYMDMVTTTVMEHGGVVDDFFGDGVKINFGVPIPRTTEADIGRDAINAVSCALAMEAKMVALNATMQAQGYQPLRMRIGICTGPVVAGSLGSAERMKYTTLGDTVNTAARLESFSKNLHPPQLESRACRILIGESTRWYLGDQFELQAVGEMELKGKEKKINAFCVLGRRPTVSLHRSTTGQVRNRPLPGESD